MYISCIEISHFPYVNIYAHNASDKYPKMHNFVTEMCTPVHISVTKWYIVRSVRLAYDAISISARNNGFIIIM